MISQTLVAFLISCILLGGVNGGLDILKTPAYIKFVATNDRLQAFDLPHLVFNLFGLPNAKLTKWNGLLEGSVFKRPKAVVMITMPIDRPITSQQPLISYELIENSGDLRSEYIRRRLEAIDWVHQPLILHSSIDNMLLDVKSSYDQISSTQSAESILDDLKSSHWLENHKTGSLDYQSESHVLFLGQLSSITQSIHKIKTSNLHTKTSPAFMHFDLSSIHPLIQSPAYKDALALLNHVVMEATTQLEELFGGNVVIATVTTPLNNNNNLKLGRQLREAGNGSEAVTSIPEEENKSSQQPPTHQPPTHQPPTQKPPTHQQPTQPPPKQRKNNIKGYNRAPKYSPNYPVIFNIILWMSVVLVLSLLWISWSIWNMDPGKDSVIYRMTTQRLKRE